MTEPVQTIIVGGGPVGMGLAIELGQRGIECVLVERYEEPQHIPKGQNLTQRTMEHVHFWGAEVALRAARTIPASYGIGGLTAYGTLLGEHSYDWLQRELVKPYYYRSNERLPQYATEAVLRQRLSNLPSVQTLYGWTAQSLVQDATCVQIDIASRVGTAPRTLQAQYLIGCDGARSFVRRQSGIAQDLSDHDRTMVLLVFRSPELHALLERYPGKSYYNVLHPQLEGYWKFFGRIDLGTTWFFHAPVPSGTTEHNFDFHRYLHEAVGTQFELEIDYVGFWDLRFAVAQSYRSQRVFIAGDAAHSHPPYGGYGVNAGLEDARNLGWKIAADLQGWGGARLLDSYDEERRPVFASTAQDFIAKAIEVDKQFLASFDPGKNRQAFEAEWQARASGAVGEVHAFEPNYEGSSIIRGEVGNNKPRSCSALGSHKFEARAGHHLAPVELSDKRNVFEALGTGYTLLCFGAGPEAAPRFASAAMVLSLPLTIVEDSNEGQRTRYLAQVILVRPDHFIAWAGMPADSIDAEEILRIASGQQAVGQRYTER